jgi:DNA excision repair protein ERCC-8
MAEAVSSSGLSLHSLIEQRCEGRLSAVAFRNRVRRQRAPKALSRLTTIASTERSVTSLQIHPRETRFLVTGSTAGKCTIYNLSRYGSQPHTAGTAAGNDDCARRHHPIAQTSNVAAHVLPAAHVPPVASMATATDTSTNNNNTSAATLGPVTCTRWYPADSGAFLSAHVSGSLLLWDTNALQPVLTVQPFAAERQPHRDPLHPNFPSRSAVLTSMETSVLNPQLVATASADVAAWRLVDLRTGAASHRCTGHRGTGVTALAWSPLRAHVVASGGSDGSIRLWDIRKAGRYAWLGSPLDADAPADPDEDALIRHAFQPDYSHWNNPAITRRSATTHATSRVRRRPPPLAKRPSPNDYSDAKSTSVHAHRGAVTALAFDPVGAHHLVSYGSVDHQVRLWDLTQAGGGRLVPRHYDLPPRQSHHIPTRLAWPDRGSLWVAQGLHLHQFGWESGGAAQQRLVGHLKRIQALDVCPETGNVFTGGADGLVLVWSSSSHAKASMGRGNGKRKLPVDRDNW